MTSHMQVRDMETALDAKRAVCDRLERQLQLSANQLQRQHDVEQRCSDAQRRLRCAETTIQGLQADMQVRPLQLCVQNMVQAFVMMLTCFKALPTL